MLPHHKSVLKPHSVATAVMHGAILALSEQSSEWGWHCAGVTQGAVPAVGLCSSAGWGEVCLDLIVISPRHVLLLLG